MGAKLTKTKSLSISEKIKEQSKEIDTIADNTNNHVNLTINEGKKQVEKNKNQKKKQESKLNKKSSKIKLDKSTNTENCVLSSSTFIEQLVDGQLPTVNNNGSLDVNTAQMNAGYQSELPNKYLQEFRAACLKNNITSIGIHDDNQKISNEYEYQVNNLNITEDTTNNASVIIDINNDQIQNQEKQQQSIES